MNHDNLDRALNATPGRPRQPMTWPDVAAVLGALALTLGFVAFVLWLTLR